MKIQHLHLHVRERIASEEFYKACLGIARPFYRDEAIATFRCADPDGYAIEINWEA
jgi:catechol-2,3-dioxygenase